MESSWRLNVWESGWANAGFRYVARIRSGPATGIWIASADYYSVRDFLYRVDDNPVAGWIWDIITPGMGKGFPWGFDVDPD